jgi:hypothetical protein
MKAADPNRVSQSHLYCWDTGPPMPHHLGYPVVGDHLCTNGELQGITTTTTTVYSYTTETTSVFFRPDVTTTWTVPRHPGHEVQAPVRAAVARRWAPHPVALTAGHSSP